MKGMFEEQLFMAVSAYRAKHDARLPAHIFIFMLCNELGELTEYRPDLESVVECHLFPVSIIEVIEQHKVRFRHHLYK